MKKATLPIYVIALLTLILQFTAAQATQTVYEQLCQLNKYWQQHSVFINQQTQISNHEALIRFHLQTVESYLRLNPPANLSGSQTENRNHCLDILHQYWTAGVFPKNTHHNYTLPYFIDNYNTACAVGHLIRETGYEALACHISDEMNYAYLEEMPYPEIPQWASLMGFDVAELKWIQPAYAPPISIQHLITPATCGQENGGINITVVDFLTQMPVSGYEQVWYRINGNTFGLVSQSEDIQNRPAGLYKSSVVTNQGMYPVVYDLIGLGSNSNLNITANLQHETCNGSKDGSITLNINGGTAPYSVRWYNQSGAFIGTGQSLANLSGLSFGIIMYQISVAQYTAEITDANGCKTFGQYNLETLHESPYFFAGITNPTCGQSNGTVTLQYVPEGAEIAWSQNAALTGNIANNLAAGTYTVTITNQYGCQYVSQIQVSDEGQNNINTVTATPENCGQGNGSLNLPNLPDVTYSWSHNSTWHEHYANNLSEGYYTVSVTNSSGCQEIHTYYIYNTDIYLYQSDPINISNANSINGTLGTIELSNYPVGQLSFSWSQDASLNSNIAPNLAAGNYSVTITDIQTGCSAVQQFEIYDAAFLGTSISLTTSGYNANLLVNNQNLILSYHYNDQKDLQLRVYNMTGKMRFAQNLGKGTGQNQTTVSINTLPAGMYVLQLSNGLNTQSLKFVKQ